MFDNLIPPADILWFYYPPNILRRYNLISILTEYHTHRKTGLVAYPPLRECLRQHNASGLLLQKLI
jgi:hypothetical protein